MTINRKHVIGYVALINLQFPNAYRFATEQDREAFVNLWFYGLKNYPKEVCDVAVKNAVLKAEFAPKIATVVKEIESLIETFGKNDGELWNELTYALEEIRDELPYASEKYNTAIHDDTGLTTAGETRKRISKVYDGLDLRLKKYLVNMRGFMDLARVNDDDLQFEKGRFMKRLPIIEARLKVQEQMPTEIINFITDLSGKKLIGENNG